MRKWCWAALLGCGLVLGQPEVTDTVVVTGRLPGPPLWRVFNGERSLWIFGYVSPIPEDMQWESARVERVLANADAYLPPPDLEVTVSPLVALNPINLWRGVRLARRLSRNEDRKSLSDVLPPELYARYAALKARYFPRNDSLEALRPVIAGSQMTDLIQDEAGLGSAEDILKKIQRLPRRQRDLEREATNVDVRIEGGYRSLADRAEAMMASITPEQELGCFEWQVGRMETDLEAMKSRANSWALGYIDEFLDAPLRRGDEDPCFRLLLATSESDTIEDLLAQGQQRWLASAEKALQEHDSTFAVLHIRELLNEGGLLNQLKAKGYRVQEPD